MILFLEYGTGTDQVHVELDAQDIYTEDFAAGVFESPARPITVSSARIVLLGRPSVQVPVEYIYKIANQLDLYQGRNLGPLLYIFWHPTGDVTDLHRARLYRLQFTPDIDRGYIGKRLVKAALFFTHGPWEAVNETQIALTNIHGADDLAGLQIDNTHDAANDHTIAIKADAIEGDIPSPARIEITRTWVDAGAVRYFWIGHNVHSDPENLDHVLEAEEGTGGAVQVNVTMSDGEHVDGLTATTTEGTMITWAISAAMAKMLAGNHFHIMMRSGSGSPQWLDCWHRFSLVKTGSGNDYYFRGEQFMLDANLGIRIRDFDCIRIPSWYVDPDATQQAIDLLWQAQAFTGTESLKLDALYLFAADSFRTYTLAVGLAAGDRIVDDSATGISYLDTGAGTGRGSYITVAGTPLMLWPGKYQKLYFLCHTGSANTAPIDITHTVKMFYRPRRLKL